MNPEPPEPLEVPDTVQKRLNEWNTLFRLYKNMQIVIGCSSLVASAFAALNLGKLILTLSVSQWAAVYSAAVIGILGFVQPGKQYAKFVAAWRVLDNAVDKYRYGYLPLKDLLEEKARGELIIGGYEREESNPKE